MERHQDFPLFLFIKKVLDMILASLMKVSYDAEHFNMDELLSLRPCYWDKENGCMHIVRLRMVVLF